MCKKSYQKALSFIPRSVAYNMYKIAPAMLEEWIETEPFRARSEVSKLAKSQKPNRAGKENCLI